MAEGCFRSLWLSEPCQHGQEKGEDESESLDGARHEAFENTLNFAEQKVYNWHTKAARGVVRGGK
jgi:hypothetical protein